MKIVDVKIDDVKPYENNPRKNDNAVSSVAESIRQFGFLQPLVLDPDNTIVVGHTRYKAARELGLETVPAVYADDLSESQIKAYRLLDNRLNEIAVWDIPSLRVELDDLPDFDFSDFGISFDLNDQDIDISDLFDQDTASDESKEKTFEILVYCGDKEEQDRIFKALREEGINAIKKQK